MWVSQCSDFNFGNFTQQEGDSCHLKTPRNVNII